MNERAAAPAATAPRVRILPWVAAAGALAGFALVWLLVGPGLLLLGACVVAGYGITHLSALALTVEERLAFGTVLGAMAVTMAAFLAALVLGFGLPAVACGALAGLGLGAAGWFTGRARHRPELMRLRERWLAHPLSAGHPWPLALLLIICWPYTLKLLSQAYVYTPDGLYAGYVNIWGDWAAHLTFASSFSYSNNLPPQFSIDPGHNLGYPFMIDFLAASLTSLGAALTSSLVLSSGLLALAFPAVFYLAGLRLTGSRVAAFLGLFVFALAGGLGFVQLAGDINNLGPAVFAHLPREYTLDRSQNYQLLDPVLAYLLPQRSTLFGFAGALVVMTGLWMAREQDDWRPYTFLGIAAGLLPLFHVHAYGTVVALAAFWALIERRPQWLAFFVPAIVIGVPELVWLWPPSGSGLRLQVFWLADSDGHKDGPVWFWLKNTSLFIPLLLAAFVWKGTLNRGLALRLAPLWLWFLVPNLFIFQPWDWDNTKFFAFWTLFGSLAVGALLARIGAVTTEGRVLVAGLILLICLSGALDVSRALDFQVSSVKYTDAGGLKVAAWVRENTPASAVFLTSSDHNEPVTSLTGRQVVCGYTGWLFTYGLTDYFTRQSDAEAMLSGQPGTDQLIRRYRVAYVVIGPLERNGAAHASDAYWLQHASQVYAAGGYSVYKVESS